MIMNGIGVLKLGGGAGVEHGPALADIAARVARGERWIVVHGASDAANRLAEAQGYPARTLVTPGGHTSRYTDARTLAIFCEAAAAVNAELTDRLTALGAAAIGLTEGVILAERKTAIRALVGGRQVIVRDDYSGSITGIDTARLSVLLNDGLTPVIAPIALGGELGRLNVDGDRAAAAIAAALGADVLIILSNVPGLLRDLADPGSLIPAFTRAELPRYEGFAAGRMKKKLLAAREAGAARVILADSRCDHPVTAALAGGGTHIYPTAELALT